MTAVSRRVRELPAEDVVEAMTATGCLESPVAEAAPEPAPHRRAPVSLPGSLHAQAGWKQVRDRERAIKERDAAAQAAIGAPPAGRAACVHHWLIETPNGPTSEGKCKKCGAAKDFANAGQEFNTQGEYQAHAADMRLGVTGRNTFAA